MAKLEDLTYKGNLPFRPQPRNRIEEALMPALKKLESQPPESAPAPLPNPQRKAWRKVVLLILAVVVIGAFVSGSYLIYKQYKINKAASPDTTLDEVGKLMALPEGEEPTIATVNDLAPLKSEPFFANAAVGDKVLIYSTAKKAILYRPSTKKVIIVAPIR